MRGRRISVASSRLGIAREEARLVSASGRIITWGCCRAGPGAHPCIVSLVSGPVLVREYVAPFEYANAMVTSLGLDRFRRFSLKEMSWRLRPIASTASHMVDLPALFGPTTTMRPLPFH